MQLFFLLSTQSYPLTATKIAYWEGERNSSCSRLDSFVLCYGSTNVIRDTYLKQL